MIQSPSLVEQTLTVPTLIEQTLTGWWEGFFRILPNIAVAILVWAVFWLMSWTAQKGVSRWGRISSRDNLGDVLGSFVRWMMVLAGTLVALTIVLPNLKPADLVAGLGITSVAIGFAFKDILQNWLAGLLLLFSQPFKIGDQVAVKNYEGTVVRIETRATLIKLPDGRVVILPNAEVYTSAIVVNTASEDLRSEIEIPIAPTQDIEPARKAGLAALEEVSGIRKSPAPDIIIASVTADYIMLRIRFWTASRRSKMMQARADVHEAVLRAFKSHRISMPKAEHVVLAMAKPGKAAGQRMVRT